jgi:hypothetical protein
MKTLYAVTIAIGLFGCGYKHVPQKAYLITYEGDRPEFLKLLNARLEGMELNGPGAVKPAFEQGDIVSREYYRDDFLISLYSEKPFELRLTCVERIDGTELSGDASAKCALAVFLVSTIKGVKVRDVSRH